ncbi:MAG: hypothetical protein ACI8PZ_001085 [Myxococcota bacterium]|jgi:hypothetical protein
MLALLLLLTPALAGADAVLTITGECPGPVDFEMRGSEGGRYLLVAADEAGSYRLASGRCEGADIGLLPPLSGYGPFPDLDVDSVRTIRPVIPDVACAKQFVLLDLSTCAVSEVASFGPGPVDYVGSYGVNDGPVWGVTPPYTCLEACAVVFGGDADDYQCSTEPDVVTNTGWYQGWGTSEHCASSGAPLPEVIVHCPAYPDYVDGCFSAYNNDGHCGEESVNHCFTR